MGKFAVGQVVTCPFPFSNLKYQKVRPAVVVAIADFDDLILCQITSKTYSSSNPISLLATDFKDGNLPIHSYARPDKLFTVESSVISKVYGILKPEKTDELLKAIRVLFKTGSYV